MQSSLFPRFIILSKAFERVNHALPIDKLKCKSIPSSVVEILQNIFRGSNICLFTDNLTRCSLQ